MITYELNTIPLYGISPAVVHVNQYEHGRQICFHVTDADGDDMAFGGEYSSMTVTLNLKKGDGTIFSMIIPHEGDMLDGYVYVTLVPQMTAAAGTGYGEFVFDHQGIQHRTANFVFEVERSPLDMDGVESESLIGYVEGNRAAASEATNAAIRAAAAAESASDAANNAASSVAAAVSNIEAMPEALRGLAETLALPGEPERILAYDGNGVAGAFDIGIVTPQMYGAKGDGTADDTSAFEAALESGYRIIVPAGNYKLTSILWSDESVVVSDEGTYPNKPLIISRLLREDAPLLRLVKEFNASLSNARDYRLQSGCYDPVNERIILAFCDNVGDNVNSDLVLTAYDLEWEPIAGLSVVVENGGHGNSLVYVPDPEDPTKGKIYVAVGNRILSDASVGQIAVVDPDTLTIERFISPVLDCDRTWQVAYDKKNKIFYIEYNAGSGVRIKAYDSGFRELGKSFPASLDKVQGVGKLYWGMEEFNMQAPTVINEQYIQVMFGSKYGDGSVANDGLWQCNGGYLAQYNYHTGEVKKVYRLTLPQPGYEPQCVISVKGRYYFVADASYRNGFRQVSVSQLVMDERLSGESESVYTDAKKLPSTKLPTDLNNIMTPGLYVVTQEAGSNNARGLVNDPCNLAFSLYVLPLMVRDARAQIAISSHGEVYVRVFLPSSQSWYGWRQLAETPRYGGTRAGTWRGSGYIANSGKAIYFTIPITTQSVTSSAPQIVTVNEITLSAWQGGNTLVNEVELIGEPGWTVTAAVGIWGINVVCRKSTEINNAENLAPVGIQANISLTYGTR